MREIDVLTDTLKEEVGRTAMALKQGKVILYPTDTIWGLGCDVTNKSAVDRIYEIKQRDRDNPLIILVDGISMLKRYVPRLHPRIETLLWYHKRPLTVVYKEVIDLPQHILASDGSVAIRICKDVFCNGVIAMFGRPIVSTSANRSGQPFPGSFDEIDPDLVNEADYVVPSHWERKTSKEPSIIATYNHKGELEFIRE